jgi:hypothetical protein
VITLGQSICNATGRPAFSACALIQINRQPFFWRNVRLFREDEPWVTLELLG